MFDSHCHLTDGRFDDDRAAVLARARGAGVRGVVTVASDLDDARLARALADAEPDVWCTAGIHPHEAGSAPGDALERIREAALASRRVVAIGETGLDYHYDHSPRDVQRRLFRAQIELAGDLGLPFVVHARSADEDVMAALADAPDGAPFVLHCFS
ncbi:MAG: TatD family deoxyribonuclease, partial [Gemmatimonadetes bacterium]